MPHRFVYPQVRVEDEPFLQRDAPTGLFSQAFGVPRINSKGLSVVEVVEPGDIIGEYTGNRVLIHEFTSKKQMRSTEVNATDGDRYLLDTLDEYLVDGSTGGEMKYVNHSCKPNCRYEVWTYPPTHLRRNRVFVRATERIAPKDRYGNIAGKLYADYRYSADGLIQKCKCHLTDNCKAGNAYL